jgi:chromosome partitioning protein
MAPWQQGDSNKMALIVAMVSQKGGVGKSTLSRLLACVFAALGWNVKIADLDIKQSTSFQWRTRRLQNKIEPDVPVEQFGSVAKALALADQYDMLIMDGEPHADSSTRAIAENSQLVVIPTGLALDDLNPAVVLAHDLVKHGVPRERIVFGLCRVGDSDTEIAEARTFLERAGYDILPGSIPEKTAFRRASDTGRALTQTRYDSLNARAEEVIQGIVDRITQLTNTNTKKRSA